MTVSFAILVGGRVVRTDMEIQRPFGGTKVKRWWNKEHFRQHLTLSTFCLFPGLKFVKVLIQKFWQVFSLCLKALKLLGSFKIKMYLGLICYMDQRDGYAAENLNIWSSCGAAEYLAGQFEKSNCTRPHRRRTIYLDFWSSPPPSGPYGLCIAMGT